MTEDAFRTIALSMPDSVERSHMAHPDFRVQNKIFATLTTEGDVGVVRLTPDQQDEFCATHPGAFEPVAGAWGQRGYTRVILNAARAPAVRDAVRAAWLNTAPRKLHARLAAR